MVSLFIIQTLPKITGAMSTIGSSYVIIDVLKSPKKRAESSYHRVMVGLSISDIISSIVWISSGWSLPVGYLPGAIGSLPLCDVLGFFNFMSSVTTPLYNCSLASFYMFQLKHNLPQSKMKEKEKWMHIIPWVSGCIPAIIGLATKSFGPYGIVCMPTHGYPLGCEKEKSDLVGGTCERGGLTSFKMFTILYMITYLVSQCYVIVTMFIVYREVFSVEKNAEKYSFARYSSTQSSRLLMSKRVLIQGILYSAVLVLTMMFPLCQAFFSGVTSVPSFLRVLTVTFTPWQGFFNAIIYSMPQLLNWRRENHNSNSTRSFSNRWRSFNLTSTFANSLRNSSKTFSSFFLKHTYCATNVAKDKTISPKDCDVDEAEIFKSHACPKHDENVTTRQSTSQKLSEAEDIALQNATRSPPLERNIEAPDQDLLGVGVLSNTINENNDDVDREIHSKDYNDYSATNRRKSVTFQEAQRFNHVNSSEDNLLHPQEVDDSEENEYEGELYQETFLPDDVVSGKHGYEEDDLHLQMIH